MVRSLKKMVGETGFEPATSASQTQRSTKLSYSPSLQGRETVSNSVIWQAEIFDSSQKKIPLYSATAPKVPPLPKTCLIGQHSYFESAATGSHRSQQNRVPPAPPEFLRASDWSSLARTSDPFGTHLKIPSNINSPRNQLATQYLSNRSSS